MYIDIRQYKTLLLSPMIPRSVALPQRPDALDILHNDAKNHVNASEYVVVFDGSDGTVPRRM